MRLIGYFITVVATLLLTASAVIQAQKGVYPDAGVYFTFSEFYTTSLARTITETIVKNVNAQSIPSFKVNDGHITMDISNIQHSVAMSTPYYTQIAATTYQVGWKQVDFTIHTDYQVCYKWHMDDINICEHGKIEISTTNNPNVTLVNEFTLNFDTTSPTFSDVSTTMNAPGNAIEYSASCDSKICDKTHDIRNAVAAQFVPNVEKTITEQINAKASAIVALFPPLRPLGDFKYKDFTYFVDSMGDIVESGSSGSEDTPALTFAINGGIAVKNGNGNPVYPTQKPTFAPPASAIEEFHTTDWQALLTPFFFESLIDAGVESVLPFTIDSSMVPAESPVTLNTSDPFFAQTAPGMTKQYPDLPMSVVITVPGSEQSTFSCKIDSEGIAVSDFELLITFFMDMADKKQVQAFSVLAKIDVTLNMQPKLLSNGSVSVSTTMSGFNPSCSVASTNVGSVDTDGIVQMLQLAGSMATIPTTVVNNPSTQYKLTQLEVAYNNANFVTIGITEVLKSTSASFV